MIKFDFFRKGGEEEGKYHFNKSIKRIGIMPMSVIIEEMKK